MSKKELDRKQAIKRLGKYAIALILKKKYSWKLKSLAKCLILARLIGLTWSYGNDVYNKTMRKGSSTAVPWRNKFDIVKN